MHDPIFVHVPYHRLGLHLDALVERKLNPELFFPGEVLDALIPEQVQAHAETLRANNLACTFHAPFMDLNPGSTEPLLRNATLHRFRQVMAVSSILKPEVVVFHPGYDRWRYGDNQESWLKNSIDTWRMVLEETEETGFTVAVENIFEEEPSTLKVLIEAVDSPRFRHCFDVGHWHLFHKVSMEEWFHQLGSSIAEVHVHDNHGLKDDHAPIGEGKIDFELYFSLMKRYAPNAVYTIEAHDPHAVDRAVARLRQHLGNAG